MEKMDSVSPKIVVFGSCSVDFTTYASRLPSPGETLHGHKFVTSYGGKGANQCVAAAKLQANTAMVARVGDDVWGNDYIKYMKDLGVDTTQMHSLKNQGTGVAQINVAESGENQIVIVASANKLLSMKDAESANELIGKAAVLVCQLETPAEATLRAFQLCKGVKILNAAPALQNIDKNLLSLTDILCVNESEASSITGKPVNTLKEVASALTDLLKFGCDTAIVTLGAKGAAFARKSNPTPVRVPSDTVAAVDTTGAGDAFVGTLAAIIASGRCEPFEAAVGASCRAASLSVATEGTQESFLRGSIADLLERHYESEIIQ